MNKVKFKIVHNVNGQRIAHRVTGRLFKYKDLKFVIHYRYYISRKNKKWRYIKNEFNISEYTTGYVVYDYITKEHLVKTVKYLKLDYQIIKK